MSDFDRATAFIKEKIREAKNTPAGKSDLTRAAEFVREKMSSRHGSPPPSPRKGEHKRSNSFTNRLEAFASSTARTLRESTTPHARPHRNFQQMDEAERALLAAVLCHQPPPGAPRDQSWWLDYAEQTKADIVKLPGTLRGYPNLVKRMANKALGEQGRAECRHLCPLHEKLNRKVVRATLHFIKRDIDVYIPAILKPLRDAHVLPPEYEAMFGKMSDASGMWLERDNFEFFFKKQVPKKFKRQSDRCAACVLARLGSDLDPLLGLRAGIGLKMRMTPNQGVRRTAYVDCMINRFEPGKAQETIKQATAIADHIKMIFDQWLASTNGKGARTYGPWVHGNKVRVNSFDPWGLNSSQEAKVAGSSSSASGQGNPYGPGCHPGASPLSSSSGYYPLPMSNPNASRASAPQPRAHVRSNSGSISPQSRAAAPSSSSSFKPFESPRPAPVPPSPVPPSPSVYSQPGRDPSVYQPIPWRNGVPMPAAATRPAAKQFTGDTIDELIDNYRRSVYNPLFGKEDHDGFNELPDDAPDDPYPGIYGEAVSDPASSPSASGKGRSSGSIAREYQSDIGGANPFGGVPESVRGSANRDVERSESLRVGRSTTRSTTRERDRSSSRNPQSKNRPPGRSSSRYPPSAARPPVYPPPASSYNDAHPPPGRRSSLMPQPLFSGPREGYRRGTNSSMGSIDPRKLEDLRRDTESRGSVFTDVSRNADERRDTRWSDFQRGIRDV